MSGSIGKLAEQVLQEVKEGNLVKLAEYRMVKEACEKPTTRHPFSTALVKLAEILRRKTPDVSIEELKGFLKKHAR